MSARSSFHRRTTLIGLVWMQLAAIAAPSPATPPLPPSPVEQFRMLLEMSPAEQDAAVADRPDANRAVIKAKLSEYAAMSPSEREARLGATEMRWHLRPLMEMPPAQRARRLNAIPDAYRDMVKDRLAQWDFLSPEVQKVVLENEWALRYFIQWNGGTPTPPTSMARDLSAKRRQELDSALVRWTSLPAARRAQTVQRFQSFFELPSSERERTLEAVPLPQRGALQETLTVFDEMAPEQRHQCLDSFRALANMTPEARIVFLTNADRWKEMTSQQRQTWRSVAKELPPLPPGLAKPPLPPPLERARSETHSLPPFPGPPVPGR